MDLSKIKKKEKLLTKLSKLKKVIKCVVVTIALTSLAGISIYENYDSDFESANDTETDSNATTQAYNFLSNTNVGKCVVSPNQWDCFVQCNNILLKDNEILIYTELILAAKLQFPGRNGCELALETVNFRNQSIEENWLEIIPEFPKIWALHIKYSDLAYVGPNSFSFFPDLEVLCIANTNIVHLSRQAFSNLPKLTSLSIRQNYGLSTIENGLILDLDKLNVLQIQDVMSDDPKCQNKIGQFFKNLTGNSTTKINTLDLTENCLVNVSKDFFKPHPYLANVFLRFNDLKNFEEGSLNGITRGMLLYLESNKINKLPEHVFGDFIRSNGKSLFVMDNRLECDCEMKWLQDFIKDILASYDNYDKYGNFSKMVQVGDFKEVMCETPARVPFLEAEMCPDDGGVPPPTTQMPIITTSTTTETTPVTSTTPMPTTTTSTANETTPATSPIPNTTPTTSATETTPATSPIPNTTPTTIPTTEFPEPTTDASVPPNVNITDTTTESDQTTGIVTYPGAPDDGDQDYDQIVEIKCHAQNKKAPSRIIRSVNSYSSFQLQIGNFTDQGDFVFTLAPKTQRFQVSDSEESSLKITFEAKAINSNRRKNIVWLTYNNIPEMKKSDAISSNCSTVVPENPYIIKNLEPERSYLICVSDDQDYNVNLLDCVPYTTKALAENQAWLTFSSKPMAISLLVGAAIGAFVIGCGILYYLIRQNPTLIEGSKSVIVVKRQEKKQVMIMPKDYDTSTIKKLRKLSDAYSVVSYISAIQPSQEELLSYRLERLKAMRALEEKQKLTVPNSDSTPRSSVKTTISDYTIYENDFELSQNYEQEYH